MTASYLIVLTHYRQRHSIYRALNTEYVHPLTTVNRVGSKYGNPLTGTLVAFSIALKKEVMAQDSTDLREYPSIPFLTKLGQGSMHSIESLEDGHRGFTSCMRRKERIGDSTALVILFLLLW